MVSTIKYAIIIKNIKIIAEPALFTNKASVSINS